MTMSEKIFNNFARERNLSPGSINVYQHALNKYVEFNNMSLAELIEEADCEEEQGIRWKRRTLKHRLIDFRNYLIDYGYAKETINTMMKRVTTLYHHHEIEIHHLPRVNISSTVEIRLPTLEELQLAIESSEPIMKALTLFITSSGLSKVDVLKLTVRDFIKATSDYHNTNDIMEIMAILNGRDDVIPTFSLTRTKTNKFFHTFCTPEATTAILNYLYSRKDKLTHDSPLFKVSYYWLSEKYEALNESLNLGVTKGNNYSILRCHTLRKYHATTLRNHGLSIDIINSLQGKAKNKVDAVYFVDSPEMLKREYVEHMEALFISPECRVRTELDVTKEKNTQLASENVELKKEKEETKRRIDNLEKIVLGDLSDDEKRELHNLL